MSKFNHTRQEGPRHQAIRPHTGSAYSGALPERADALQRHVVSGQSVALFARSGASRKVVTPIIGRSETEAGSMTGDMTAPPNGASTMQANPAQAATKTKESAYGQPPPIAVLMTVSQLSESTRPDPDQKPALGPGAIRWDILHEETNGLREARAIVKRGRRILIDRDAYLRWLLGRDRV